MSLDDMRYVEKAMEKKPKTPIINHVGSDDDIPLALAKNVKPTTSKKAPRIDWFDFFLSAGCEVDDCTRYSAAFERDKIDETLLGDITEGTMRSLGLREGDIIRVKKAIDKRKPADNLQRQSAHLQEQIRRDEELARQLQAQENAAAPTPAPNLFAGPGGVLKPPRRGRPQSSKTLPPTNVDLIAISSASGQIRKDDPSRISTSSPLPPRPSSAAAGTSTSGFEDDAWTNRPGSTRPFKSTSPTGAKISSAVKSPPVLAPTPTSPPKPESSQTAQGPTTDGKGPTNLAKTTDADIFDQLARLSELRKNSTPQAPQAAQQTAPQVIQPPGYQNGLGMGHSPLPLAQLANSTIPPNQTSNGPRGPYAPVPANQGLLQPLIPTQTGFGGFIPTKPTQSQSPFQNHLSMPSFIPPQATGFPGPSPIMTHPTGAYGNFGGAPFQRTPDNFTSLPGLMTSRRIVSIFVLPRSSPPLEPTGFNPQMNMSPFSNSATHSPAPSSNSVQDTSPANVFAQMKSGTFANEDNPNGWFQEIYSFHLASNTSHL
jgi:hypothetical protein